MVLLSWFQLSGKKPLHWNKKDWSSQLLWIVQTLFRAVQLLRKPNYKVFNVSCEQKNLKPEIIKEAKLHFAKTTNKRHMEVFWYKMEKIVKIVPKNWSKLPAKRSEPPFTTLWASIFHNCTNSECWKNLFKLTQNTKARGLPMNNWSRCLRLERVLKQKNDWSELTAAKKRQTAAKKHGFRLLY